jgi:general secretion pathway protein M
MTLELSPRQHCAAAVLLLALAAAAGLSLLASAWQQYRANVEEIETLGARLAQFHALRGRRAELAGQIEMLEQGQGPDAQAFLAGGSPALAAANLQARVKQQVESGGGRLISTQAMPVDGADRFPRIVLKVHMNASVEALRGVLFGLETGNPRLYIEQLAIQSYQRDARRAPGGGAQPALDVHFELSGYTRAKS